MKRDATPIVEQPPIPALTVYIIEIVDSGKSKLVDVMLDGKRAERWVERFNSEIVDDIRHSSCIDARAYVHELTSQPAQSIVIDAFAGIDGNEVLSLHMTEDSANAWMRGFRRTYPRPTNAEVRPVSATLALK
jgi:hypothetical protein